MFRHCLDTVIFGYHGWPFMFIMSSYIVCLINDSIEANNKKILLLDFMP